VSKALLATLPRALGVSVTPVRIPDWDRPNGFSVLAGARAICGAFLLLMSDHLFDPGNPAPTVARRAGRWPS
jgi:choline kinase